jgi:hypothetical protein
MTYDELRDAYDRLTITYVNNIVLTIIHERALEQWWHTPLPHRNYLTATELLWMGKNEELIEHVEGYLSEDFS